MKIHCRKARAKAGQLVSHSTNQRGWLMVVVVEVIRSSWILGLFWRWIICAELMYYVRKERHNSACCFFITLYFGSFQPWSGRYLKNIKDVLGSVLPLPVTYRRCLFKLSLNISIDMEFTSIESSPFRCLNYFRIQISKYFFIPLKWLSIDILLLNIYSVSVSEISFPGIS